MPRVNRKNSFFDEKVQYSVDLSMIRIIANWAILVFNRRINPYVNDDMRPNTYVWSHATDIVCLIV